MKTQIMLFVLIAVSMFSVSSVYGDIQIDTVLGSGAPGCEETAEGCYTPNSISVDMGEVITFLNRDVSAHTFTSGHPDSGPDGHFDTGLLMAGKTYDYTPVDEGVIDYFCMVHPWAMGKIVVGEGVESIAPISTQEADPGMVSSDSALLNKIQELKEEIVLLRQENMSLRQQIDTMKDDFIGFVIEFTENLRVANLWYQEQLSQNTT
ncbi:MAG: hypothetical protein OES34_06645 [Nitrosopumilus sp.]|nr:hypothetical protein [Nitrosopumilus sp.]